MLYQLPLIFNNCEKIINKNLFHEYLEKILTNRHFKHRISTSNIYVFKIISRSNLYETWIKNNFIADFFYIMKLYVL